MRKSLWQSLYILFVLVFTAGCSQYGAFDVMDSLAGVSGAPEGIWEAQIADLSAVASHQRVELTWSDPSSQSLAHIAVSVSPTGQTFEVAPGEQRLEIRPLENNISYAFTLRPVSTSGAAGAAAEISATPALSALPDDEWVDASSTVRRRIIIDNSGQQETLSGFQLLVALDGSVIDYGGTDGTDLRFYEEGTQTELPYEIEHWDESGTSLVWVRVPEVAGAYPQDYIWMYWGSGVVSTSHDPAAVWSEYELVYHFDSLSTGVAVDSSPHGRDGVLRGTPSEASGLIGNGIRVGDSITSRDYVELSAGDLASIASNVPGAYTVEVYARGDSSPQLTSPSGPLMAQHFYNIGWDHNNTSYLGSFHYRDASAGWTPVSQPQLEGDTWYYLAGAFDGSSGTVAGYADGELVNELTGMGSEPGSVVSYLRIGTDGDDGNVFDGVVDEVRIAHVARSADWMAAQQLSMSRQMVSFGAAEPKP